MARERVRLSRELPCAGPWPVPREPESEPLAAAMPPRALLTGHHHIALVAGAVQGGGEGSTEAGCAGGDAHRRRWRGSGDGTRGASSERRHQQ